MTYEGLEPKLQSALDSFPRFCERLRSARRVLLKPNVMGLHNPARGRTTHPEFLRALIVAIRTMTRAEIVVGDGAGPGVHTPKAFAATGIADIAGALGVPVRAFTTAPMSIIEVPNPYLYHQLELAAELAEFDVLINVPKLKTTYASPAAGMKNLMGLMSQPYRFMFHAHGLHEGVADLNTVVVPQLTVVDGILGCELRWPRKADVFVVGEDPVATDTVCSDVMSIPTERTPYLKLASMKGLGQLDRARIDVVGTPVDEVRTPFKVPPQESPESLSTEMVKVIDCGACCIGCVGTIQKGIDDIRRDGLLPRMRKPMTVVIGPNWDPSQFDQSSTLLIGNCAVGRARTWPNVVRGCPPLIHKFSEKLVAVSEQG